MDYDLINDGATRVTYKEKNRKKMLTVVEAYNIIRHIVLNEK